MPNKRISELDDGTATIAGTDEVPASQTASALTRRLTLASIRTLFKATYDGLYAALIHGHAQSDVANLITDLAGKAALTHATRHQDGGADEINVTGLSGELNDAQKTTFKNAGNTFSTRAQLDFLDTGDIDFTGADGASAAEISASIKNTVVTEAKLNLSDNTTADVSTTKHGFVPKLPNDSTKFLNGVGAFAVPASGGSPGGADGDLQYKSGTSFAAEAALNYDAASNQLTIPGVTIAEDTLFTGVISPTPSTDQDDYAPTGHATATIFRLNPSASINISGLQGGVSGRVIKLINVTTDYVILLTHEDSSSATAGNRFNFGSPLPFYALLPGGAAEFYYDGTASRWRFLYGSVPATLAGQFDNFDDCHIFPDAGAGGTTPTGFLGITAIGTAANVTPSVYGVDATEKVQGAITLDTGSTNAGDSHYCSGGVNITPTVGGVFLACRLAVETASDGTNTFQCRFGISDAPTSAADVNDGVYWEGDANTNAAWQTACAGSGTRSKSANGPNMGTTYVILGIWINPDWTRADFFYSSDSIACVVSAAGTQSGANMPTATETTQIEVGISKTAGVTSRNLHVDWIGTRFTNGQR